VTPIAADIVKEEKVVMNINLALKDTARRDRGVAVVVVAGKNLDDRGLPDVGETENCDRNQRLGPDGSGTCATHRVIDGYADLYSAPVSAFPCQDMSEKTNREYTTHYSYKNLR
jgi:hypothetical protein